MRKGLFFAGLLVLGTGFYIVLLALGVFPGWEGEGPAWILGLAGMAFVVGGGLVSIGELIKHDDASALRDLEVAKAFRNIMIALLLIIFVILGNWVAFGSGTRPLQAGLELPFMDVSGQTSEWVGRFGFGVGAVTLDGVLVAMIVALVRRYQREQPGGD